MPSDPIDFINSKISSLTKKKEIAKLDEKRLTEENDSQKIKQEKNLENLQNMIQFGIDIQTNMEDSFNNLKLLKQYIIIVSFSAFYLIINK